MRKSRSQSGGALLVVIVVLLISAAIVAGWLAVTATQAKATEVFEEASNHRIAFANADAAARQYMLNSVVATSSAPGVDVTLDDGSRIVMAASSTEPFSTTGKAAGYNHFNPGNGDGYTVDVAGVIYDGRMDTDGTTPLTTTRLYEAKSRSPVLSGDLFIGEKPTLSPGASSSVSGSMDIVDGRTLLWAPNSPNTFSMTTQNYTAPADATVVLHDSSGSTLLMSNFPFVPVTSGQVGGAPSYSGYFDVIHNTSGINSLEAKILEGTYTSVDGSVATTPDVTPGITCDGSGTVTLQLCNNSGSLANELGNVLLTGNVSTLILQGQSSDADYTTADSEEAVLVLLDQTASSTRDLATVQMTERNSRRIVLAIKKSTAAAVNFDVPNAGAGAWRAILTLENTPITWTLAGGATQTLAGGIQTDSSVSVPAGALSINWETTPAKLDRLTARDGWVEGYDQ
jgi:hypothetical protein